MTSRHHGASTMAALAWGKFFWRDWTSDVALRRCSLAAHGLWMSMLCIAAQHEPPGFVSVNGEPLDADGIAEVIGRDKGEVNRLLKELVNRGVCSRDETTGAIFCRRMVSDAARSTKAQANGKLGGNPSLGKRSKKDRSVNHLLKPQDKPQVNGELNLEIAPELKHRVQSQSPEKESKDSVGKRLPTVDEDFEKFWKGYPRTPTMSKKETRAAWEKLTEADRASVLAAGPKYARWLTSERAKRPDAPAVHAVRFITQRRFEGFNEPPDPEQAPAGEPLFKHGDRAPASAGRLAGYIYWKSETPEWDRWSRYNKGIGRKSMPVDKFGGWFFPTAAPPE